MSHGFDTALVNRARNRALLAKALEEKNASETRVRSIKRLFVVALVVGSTFYVVRHTSLASKNKRPVASISLAEVRKELLAQIKKQLTQPEQMMINPGAINSLPTLVISKGERNSFAEEKVPMHLFSEIVLKNNSRKKVLLNYAPPSSNLKKEIEEMAKRATQKPKVDCAMYRPMIGADKEKLPPLPAKKPNPARDLYVELKEMPPLLSRDFHTKSQ